MAASGHGSRDREGGDGHGEEKSRPRKHQPCLETLPSQNFPERQRAGAQGWNENLTLGKAGLGTAGHSGGRYRSQEEEIPEGQPERHKTPKECVQPWGV